MGDCVVCKAFSGSPEKENMCSSCYLKAHPEIAAAQKAQEAERNKNRIAFKAAVDSKNKEELAKLIDLKTKDSHLEFYIHDKFLHAVTSGTLEEVSWFLDSDFVNPAFNDNEILMRCYSQNMPNLPNKDAFERFLSVPAIKESVTTQLLEKAIMMGGGKGRTWFVRRLLAPEFTDSGKVQITESCVEIAKGAISGRNSNTADGREILKIMQEGVAANKKRATPEGQTEEKEEAAEDEEEEKPKPKKAKTKGPKKAAAPAKKREPRKKST